jgi:hypothetical protein
VSGLGGVAVRLLVDLDAETRAGAGDGVSAPEPEGFGVHHILQHVAVEQIPVGAGPDGRTPLVTRFEEDAVAQGHRRVRRRPLLTAGLQGVVLTSNAAPHHPMWHTDRNWMRKGNARITTA